MSQSNFDKFNDITSFQSSVPMAKRWLEWQCKMVTGVKLGAVYVKVKEDVELLASWPNHALEKMEDALHKLATDAMMGQNHISSKINCHLQDDTHICDAVSIPLRYHDQIIGTVIFLQTVRSEEQKKAVMQLFKWGCTWLESSLVSVHEEKKQLHPIITQLTKLALMDEPIEVSGYKICNLFAEQLECTRVALGEMKGLHVHTIALSHQLRFDKRVTTLVRGMEVAMEEAIDQNETLDYPKFENVKTNIMQKHKALSDANDEASILSIPFVNAEDTKLALLLMRPKNRDFSKQEISLLQHTMELLGPALTLKLRSEHSVAKKVKSSIKERIAKLVGKERMGFKLSVATLGLLLMLLSFMKTDQYIYAKSSLEGSKQQIIVAPQQGFIASATLRAGDEVKEGETLVELDSHELKLEHQKISAERAKVRKEYSEALALGERAKVSILLAQVEQVDAELSLLDQKLNRSNIKAPFSGVIVSGDLSQSLGAPVEKGTQLFELALLGDYRVVMKVDDHDISKLQQSQEGNIRLIGLPYDPMRVKVSRVTPVSIAEEGSNYFRVEGTILDINDTLLRPGMQGITKINVGEESMLWVWTHSLFERLRLWFWSIGL